MNTTPYVLVTTTLIENIVDKNGKYVDIKQDSLFGKYEQAFPLTPNGYAAFREYASNVSKREQKAKSVRHNDKNWHSRISRHIDYQYIPPVKFGYNSMISITAKQADDNPSFFTYGNIHNQYNFELQRPYFYADTSFSHWFPSVCSLIIGTILTNKIAYSFVTRRLHKNLFGKNFRFDP